MQSPDLTEHVSTESQDQIPGLTQELTSSQEQMVESSDMMGEHLAIDAMGEHSSPILRLYSLYPTLESFIHDTERFLAKDQFCAITRSSEKFLDGSNKKKTLQLACSYHRSAKCPFRATVNLQSTGDYKLTSINFDHSDHGPDSKYMMKLERRKSKRVKVDESPANYSHIYLNQTHLMEENEQLLSPSTPAVNSMVEIEDINEMIQSISPLLVSNKPKFIRLLQCCSDLFPQSKELKHLVDRFCHPSSSARYNRRDSYNPLMSSPVTATPYMTTQESHSLSPEEASALAASGMAVSGMYEGVGVGVGVVPTQQEDSSSDEDEDSTAANSANANANYVAGGRGPRERWDQVLLSLPPNEQQTLLSNLQSSPESGLPSPATYTALSSMAIPIPQIGEVDASVPSSPSNPQTSLSALAVAAAVVQEQKAEEEREKGKRDRRKRQF